MGANEVVFAQKVQKYIQTYTTRNQRIKYLLRVIKLKQTRINKDMKNQDINQISISSYSLTVGGLIEDSNIKYNEEASN